jgi:uroporphyrinogen decarboxylase
VRTADDVARLGMLDLRCDQPFVVESIQRALQLLDGQVPLLGFSGAPFTLLAFLVAGQSPGDGAAVHTFLREHEAAAHELLGRLADAMAASLLDQVDAGVHAVQLFESCADLVDADGYRTWCLPYQVRALAPLAGRVPRILFARDVQDLSLLGGADAYSLATGVDLGAARAHFGAGVGLQGNVSNHTLYSGTPEEVRAETAAVIAAGGGQGHVLNQGHGILKGTPFDNVVALLDAARGAAQGSHGGR